MTGTGHVFTIEGEVVAPLLIEAKYPMSAKRTFLSAARPSPIFLSAVFLALAFSVTVAVARPDGENGGEKPPKPEELYLKTDDGVRLAATFYPGTKAKETVPVVLLHMQKRDDKDYNRGDYAELATFLQSKGHAVLVPDLRGHGDSTQKTMVGRTGALVRKTLDAASMSRNEFANMVRFDMLRLKEFLIEKNNAGELNIEKLCIVGAGMGASVALHWTRSEWNVLPKAYTKQGQDVKVLILISPEWSTPGLSLAGALAGRAPRITISNSQLKRVFRDPDAIDFRGPVEIDFRREVAVLIAAGRKRTESVNDAQRLHRKLKNFHRTPPRDAPKAERDLFYGTLPTSLQGTKILGIKELAFEKAIQQYIDIHAVKRSFHWEERKDPYG